MEYLLIYAQSSKFQTKRNDENLSELIIFTCLRSSIRCRKVVYKLVVIHVCETSVGQIVFTIRTLKSEIGNKIYDILLTAKKRLIWKSCAEIMIRLTYPTDLKPKAIGPFLPSIEVIPTPDSLPKANESSIPALFL